MAEAQALARLPSVSGIDAPPASTADQPGWLDDWAARGREVLTTAWGLVQSADTERRELGRRIAARIASGGRAAWRAATAPARAGARALREVVQAADTLARAWLTTNTIIIIAGAAFAAWYFFGRKPARNQLSG
jgi:hypothetical protein